VLPAAAWAEWLDRANDDVEDLLSLLVPAPAELFERALGEPGGERRAQRRPQLLDPPAP